MKKLYKKTLDSETLAAYDCYCKCDNCNPCSCTCDPYVMDDDQTQFAWDEFDDYYHDLAMPDYEDIYRK